MVLFRFAVASVDVIIVVLMGVVEVVLEVSCFIEVVCKSSHVAELQKKPFLCKNFCDTLYVLGIVDLRLQDFTFYCKNNNVKDCLSLFLCTGSQNLISRPLTRLKLVGPKQIHFYVISTSMPQIHFFALSCWHINLCFSSRVAEVGSLSAGTKMVKKISSSAYLLFSRQMRHFCA